MHAADLTTDEYTVLGVLWAAKFETGPKGARRSFRIWMRTNDLTENRIDAILQRLLDLNMIRFADPQVFGFVYYEVIPESFPTDA